MTEGMLLYPGPPVLFWVLYHIDGGMKRAANGCDQKALYAFESTYMNIVVLCRFSLDNHYHCRYN